MSNRTKQVVRVVPPAELLSELQERASGRTPPGTVRNVRGSRRGHQSGRARVRLAGVLGAIALMAVGITGVLAVHDAAIVELDGNLADDTGLPPFTDGVDWQEFQNSTTGAIIPAKLPAGTVAATGVIKDFVAGATGPDPSYHEPSNKDDEAIDPLTGSGVWGCVSANNPTDKNEIVNAYAIAVEKAGDLYIYFGVERYDNSGTAFIGVWLFQADVTCNLATGKFEGQKTTGDILVLTNFTNGGAITSLQAYRWIAGATLGAAGTFELVNDAADCDLAAVDEFLCGNVNLIDVETPWPFEDKDKPGQPNPDPDNIMEISEFFEGGINLTEAFEAVGQTVPECFGSFLAETRSSDVLLGATLKDFALGDFNTCGDITGHKYHDLNKNGLDNTEPDLSGWTIFIDEDNDETLDPGEESAVTDANGDVSFTGLTFGSYEVCELLTANWINSDPGGGTLADPNGSTLCQTVILTASGPQYVDFGNWQPATKSGIKFNDLDADGVKDGAEPGLENWRIYVDYNGNNAYDAATEPSDLTDATGAYLITGINPGAAVDVREVDQAGWTCSFPNPAGTPSVSSDCEYTETFTSGAAEVNNHFGNWQPATKSGIKFNDLDADGVKDGAEPGLENWRIYVDYNGNNAYDAATEPSDLTDATGAYLITGINPGAAVDVREVDQAGWTCSFPNPAGTPSVSSDCEYTETFTSGAAEVNNHFGNWQPATKSGIKFNDLDADGVKDGAEPGLENWRIYVDYNGNNAYDAATEPSDLTDATGAYLITGINPGAAVDVREVDQAGWTCSFPNPAGTPSVSSDCEYTETFTSGAAEVNNHFGNWQPATKSGIKFNDLDADGVKDGAEPGLENWRIYVDYNGNNAYDAATEPSDLTDATGAYLITGINPGAAVDVREVDQAGWTCSFPNPAGTPSVSSDCEYTETFTSGAAEVNNHFGNWQPATKSGIKFEDLDADGSAREAGEPGLGGWVIYVDYNNNSGLDAGEPSATTSSAAGTLGQYTIIGINPGTWNVREVGQAGWTCSFPNPCLHNETFTSGAALTNNDFGNMTTATKSGTKFEDLDADGSAREAGEPGLAGWTIYVDYDDDSSLDAGEPSAVTDANGDYLITGITPGTWNVREVAQADWTCSFPNPCSYNETFLSGEAEIGNDFGNWEPAAKSGTKFEDLDADGSAQEAGEPGLAGWTIYVDYDDDGILDAGEPSDVTDSDGNYEITGINPGTWRVKEVAQAGWTQSYPAGGYHEEIFTSGAALTDNDFGNWEPATKSGTKFEDLDADGAAREAGEPGLAGWTIYVDYDNDSTLDAQEPSDVTDSDGNYEITGIDPGTWNVREVAQAGWTCSYPNPCVYNETFESGDALTDNDFGNWAPASKAGTKFEDLDNDGAAREAGEPGLEGWTIYADINGNSTFDPTEPNDVTDANGDYRSAASPPASYTFREVTEAGWTCTYPNPCEWAVTLDSQEADTGNDFGNFRPATKSGTKFEDLDADGAAQEAGEPGLPGWVDLRRLRQRRCSRRR